MRRVVAALFALAVAAPAFGQARHGSHASQHGGQFTSVWEDTLHIEGVWQEQRRFRLYVFDEASRPIPPAVLARFRAAIVDDADRELSLFRVAGDGSHLEARIGTLSIPAVIAFTLTRPEGGDPERIGMMFAGYTVEPPSFEVPPTVIPSTLSGIGASLRAAVAEIGSLAEAGAQSAIYRPAIETRDLLLAVLTHAGALPADRRSTAEAAIDAAVRAAWLVHVSGDVGMPQQTRAASLELKRSINEVAVALGGFFTPLP